jgi:nucleotide-binding universal stress UspA family protein
MGIHIFFATDGSVSARIAMGQIVALPWHPPVLVTVMTAMEVPHPPFTSLLPAAQRRYDAALLVLRHDAEAKAADVLEKARLELEEHVASVATRMHSGPAGPTIVDMARACRADLLVVGSRGLGPYKGFLLGSVSEYVTRHAHCPVLLTKTAPKGELRFLVILNGSARDAKVAGWLNELDLPSSARIHMLKIVRRRRDAPEDAARVADAPSAAGIGAQDPEVTSELRFGQEVTEILGTVKEFRPEVLILGANGGPSSSEPPPGRATRKVIDHVPCSVVVVPP